MHRVMVVDDESIITTQLEERLAALGYDVVGSASSGEEALEMARQLKPDVILMDIVMPGKYDGIDASERIRKELDIPVIFLTAYADDKFVKKAKIVEPFGYVVKPYQEREIKAAIEVSIYKKSIERQLRDSEERYRALAESSIDPIFLLDRNGRYLYGNKACANISGVKQADLVGKSPGDFFPEELTKEMLNDTYRVLQHGHTIRREYTIVLNGELRYFYTTLAPVRNDSGHVVSVMGNAIDITKRKQAEERIEHLNLVLRAMRNVNQLITRAKDRDRLLKGICDTLIGTRSYYNAWLVLLDESGELLTHAQTGLGEDFSPMVERFKRGEFSVCCQRALKQSEVVVTKDPASTCTDCPLSSMYSGRGALSVRLEYDGKVYGLLSASIPTAFVTDEETTLFQEVAQDIAFALHDIELEAEHKQVGEELQKSEEKYRGLVTNIRLGIYRSTPEPAGRFLEVNPAMVEITGYSRKELLQMNVSDLYKHPEARKLVLEEVALGKGKATKEIYLRKKDGTEIIVADTKVTVKDDSDQILYFDGILEDITERKQLEEEQQKIEKLESIGTLAGGIAHDFNNLLTGIMGNIGLARRYVEPKSKTEERLLEAEKASLRARDLTQQLLTFARGGAPIKKLVSIAELIQDSTTFALRGSNVRCEFSLADDLWSVEVDEGQINQVLTNLVINADEAMPEGGILNIGAKNRVVTTRSALLLPEGNYVEITIEDHGVGIPKEHLRKIFDPYFTTKQKGSGLGLSTAYSIIKNHSSYITAKSKLGVGTTFYIYLPASKKPIPAKKKAVAETAVAGQGRILVMDDEEVIRKLLHDELTDVGYEVELTADGAEAIEQYQKAKESRQPFDAVILDLTVPGGMGGKDVIRKLLEIDPDVKAIVSSGYSTDSIMSNFRDYGLSAVVAKPYKMEQLEETLRSLLMGTSE
jgi:PAS domain S-box-containing protein